ncbi:MAG: hypothetical protein ABSA80_00375 [Terriglobales bacterium]|jgi:hypothetical protein
MDFEKMQVAALEAADCAEKERSTLRQLEHTHEAEATNLSCGDFMALSAKIAQQKERARIAAEKAAKLATEVETLRSAEAAKLAREMAQRAVTDTESRLAAAQAEIESKRAALSQIQAELPVIQSRASLLMFELSAKRDELQRLPGA